eukprot:TRINITY_DN10503_c0_g1_i1.p1 TRINITY_DN10503_c0_g1~~TRINITY_DN10503_c0_g1_i1.p1  ORF type:complete len:456 (-),score=106.90 TRINITY_DN10503_c0_g1_i1:17-1384(-)
MNNQDIFEEKKIDYTKIDVSEMIYLKSLLIEPILINLSYATCPWGAKNLEGSSLEKALNIIGKISDVENAPVHLKPLEKNHLFITQSDLIYNIQSHYKKNLTRRFYMILGSFNILGNPVSLFHELGEGFKDFVMEPTKGLNENPENFAEGVCSGSLSLFKNFVTGVSRSAENASTSIGNATANLSFDKEFIENRQKEMSIEVEHIGEGIVEGTKELSVDIIKGISGIITDPIKGAKEEGGIGFLKGVGIGVAGFITKPVTGVMDMTSRIGQGIKNTALYFDNLKKLRIRAPRYIGKSHVMTEYNGVESEGQEILMTLDEGTFRHDTYLFHYPMLEENENQFILATNKHLFSLKGKEIGRITKEWSIDVEEIKSVSVCSKSGVVISGLFDSSFFGLDVKSFENMRQITIPLSYHMSLFVYFHFSKIFRNLQRIHKIGKRDCSSTTIHSSKRDNINF